MPCSFFIHAALLKPNELISAYADIGLLYTHREKRQSGAVHSCVLTLFEIMLSFFHYKTGAGRGVCPENLAQQISIRGDMPQ